MLSKVAILNILIDQEKRSLYTITNQTNLHERKKKNKFCYLVKDDLLSDRETQFKLYQVDMMYTCQDF